jgi:hypothetical protein
MVSIINTKTAGSSWSIPLLTVSARGVRFNALASHILALGSEEKFSFSFKFDAFNCGKMYIDLDNGFPVQKYPNVVKGKTYYRYEIISHMSILKAFQSATRSESMIIRMVIGEFRDGYWPLSFY